MNDGGVSEVQAKTGNSPTVTHRTYGAQQHWRAIARHLPPRLHLDREDLPDEERWRWRGHSVHVDRYSRPDAPVKLLQLHGVGTNARMLTSIVGAPLRDRGVEPIAIDLLGYGLTDVAPRFSPSYTDWVEQVVDFLAYERTRDARPIVLYGLSAGGMLAYQAACIDRRVAGVVGMCFLDPREKSVMKTVARYGLLGAYARPVLDVLSVGPAARVRVPMKLLVKMTALVNDKNALIACLADPTSAGNKVPTRFLADYLHSKPALEPEDFDVCPILLTQPSDDRWTPIETSTVFLDRITRVPVTTMLLDRAGHYPIEEPGLTQMQDAIDHFCKTVAPA